MKKIGSPSKAFRESLNTYGCIGWASDKAWYMRNEFNPTFNGGIMRLLVLSPEARPYNIEQDSGLTLLSIQ